MQDIDIADLKRISELIHQKYNYDFRNYAMSSFKRRVLRIMELKKLTVDTLLKKLTDTPVFINEFLDELTVNVTEMFRDPSFWRVMREEIIPAIMLNHKQFKIWHAGCSSGEEVLTMCIMLKEMGILQDVTLIATDLDVNILERAKTATYPIKNMELNEKNYIRFQGSASSLKDYYREENGNAIFNRELFANVSFRKHDLVLGEIFNKFDLVLCRNVMIYFNQSLQNEVLKKFHESLFKYGYLAIGSKESLIWCDYANRFIVVNNEEKIYKKIKD
ncbi:protein-glutamate O-methyltransferase CheR [Fulvivirgaceae bacterium PWU4]|uniref:Protein-glutamate O-methyltransferase CheR n=1 Tax=Chryseosolibacter histidini TaxID=2782349 RepID=A0AAP2DHB2_9BACT|nr:protein-glutamate O-methyltransferase CheR [Chryseosolibacter histidini]MBT1696320.1 protein-glutamate O-methyltransferase CheR [Chryseosolibacter histidini]